MNDAGYTLAETLAALFIIGLAFTGLFDAMRVIGLMQTAAANGTAMASRSRAVETALSRLFDRAGPFRSNDANALTGTAKGLRFACGGAGACGALVSVGPTGAQLVIQSTNGTESQTLPGVRDAWFSYVDDRSSYAAWPLGGQERQPLRSIVLVGQTAAGEAPIAAVRIWREQEPGCRFDPISQDCRPVAP